MNASAADLFLVLAVVALVAEGALYVPRRATIFFVGVGAIALTVGAFVSPLMHHYDGVDLSPLKDGAKFVASFLYFAFGYSLARLGLARGFFRAFAIVGTGVAVLGVLSEAGGLPAIRSVMFYADVRFKGLMNDPNYAALLFCFAIVVIVRLWRGKYLLARVVSALFLSLAVLFTGSKTGLIVLASLCAWGLLQLAREERLHKRPPEKHPRLPAVRGLFAVLILLVSSAAIPIGEVVLESSGLTRGLALFSDGGSALNDEGSERTEAWRIAAAIAFENPIAGVGFGAYAPVSQRMGGDGTIAHNTYLQLLAEWGSIATAALLLFVVCILRVAGSDRVTTRAARPNSNEFGLEWRGEPSLAVARAGVILLLLGSLSISLNNVRIFWIALGVLALAASRGGARDNPGPWNCPPQRPRFRGAGTH